MDNKTVILNKFERPTMRIEGRFFMVLPPGKAN